MESFEFFDNSMKYLRKPAITVDKYGRIYLNKATRLMFGINGKKAEIYVGYDKMNRRIALVKPATAVGGLLDKRPMIFDGERAYASAKSFLDYFNIPYKDKSRRYLYVGKHGRSFVFELEDFTSVDTELQPEVLERKKQY